MVKDEPLHELRSPAPGGNRLTALMLAYSNSFYFSIPSLAINTSIQLLHVVLQYCIILWQYLILGWRRSPEV